ncbi:putative transcription factor SOX-15 isoform X3 [Polistes fuscatus]|uniref:putative transcription factor SOX-15 isoform X3 n=1 Tax=Polistes fuscatus TaxID=30207 RepID=UPI001CA86D84|nr:putative transcription factor SOX-15 isoform X3 [Polistes fuscatus]
MAANEQQRKEPKDLREPAHHARRPMNAFLIFCKRHRGSVRSGFPHLENRAVTRVLGEWWATLNPDQKRTYKNLAQEYKDAFLKANPDFKWYKLPAPPLRTLTTRPTNKKQEVGNVDQTTDSVKSEYESSDYINSDNKDSQAIQPGKLADESQIGGLSSLFTPQKVQLIDEQITIQNDVPELKDVTAPKPPKKRNPELILALEHKNECKVDLFNEKKRKHSESNNNDQHTMYIENDKTITNSFLDSNANSEENNYRGERTCKGLRYQKFLAEQIRHIGPSGQNNKRKKSTMSSLSYSPEEQVNERRNSISSNVSEKTDSLSSEGGNSSRGELEHLVESAEGNLEASKPEETETEGAESDLDFGPWTTRKRFRAEDFNLEKKIEALPSLSLEEFQEKKKLQRINKKKVLQKLNTNKWCHEDGEKSHLVGSQKRKARKQSITRNAAATTTTTTITSNMPGNQEINKTWCAPPDLEALACLAAVAANRTKLTKNNA